MAWCDEKRFSDGYIVENKKFLAFVQQVVMTRRVEKKKRRKATAKKEKFDEMTVKEETDAAFFDGLQNLDLPDPELYEGAPLKYHTVRSYVSAIRVVFHMRYAISQVFGMEYIVWNKFLISYRMAIWNI